ncbi:MULTISPECIES: MvdC/MvdD family ATP grasp protein [Citrobacter]|uniref:MvdC/MvdD family ATP grasp protein n=1 Tax=Citrobacter TaxID=544 RepID=UPI0005CCF623|nr:MULTISPECIES: hypothetical protein [Citrobacter]KLV80156.1 hypothetical protein SK39_02446 [Citrobacter sp. BIDMC107]EIX7374474.1 hypothetical protein [Citrobacter freundii]EKU2553607.1 hypothetical protein [Citrobacter freundii]KJC04754.1 hypothetical protein TO64_20360 [Citrobacter freundii]MBJ9177862.1 hypothetical protein [Citrobacter freundii]
MEENTVLILSFHEDEHAAVVKYEIDKLGGSVVVFDPQQEDDFSLIYEVHSNTVQRKLRIQEYDLDLDRLSGLWWRRPTIPQPGSDVRHPTVRKLVSEELKQFYLGCLASSQILIMNPFAQSALARFKLHQLQIASLVGLNIPATMVSTSVTAIDKFIDEHNADLIYKPFSGIGFGAFETRPLVDDERYMSEKMSNCPPILQKHIHGEYDLRITIVGNVMLCAKIDYKAGYHPVDSRADMVPITPVSIPAILQSKLFKLIDALGLVYAAIDMRFDGVDYWFFEVNPEGQFLWIELHTGLPISHAVACYLMRNSINDDSELGVYFRN